MIEPSGEFPGIRNVNPDGGPLSPAQAAKLHEVLLRHPCGALSCKAPVGQNCKGQTKVGVVHAGRLPPGFDAACAVRGDYD